MSSTFARKSFTLHVQGKSITTSKKKKGQQFVDKEEKVLCINYFLISQDPMIRNG